jgi:hypothetical protein
MCFRRRPSRREKLLVLRTEISVVSGEIERRIREADFRLAQENRLAPYVFLALIGVLGIFQLDQLQPVVDFLAANPTWLLVGVWLLLWFPVYSVIALTDLAKSLLYVRDVGAPLLNELIRQQRKLADIVVPQKQKQKQQLPRYAAWDTERGQTVVRAFGREWKIDSIIAPLSWFRFWIVASPAIGLSGWGYIPARMAAPEGWPNPWEILIYAGIVVLLVFMLFAVFTWVPKYTRVTYVKAGAVSDAKGGNAS